ncbi:GspE/PulE family protein [Cognatiluteimonas weifangensis]|uniref:General secretion pathway protein E n=1 Tax=Cognatiluteimonas weifangensis TaxID=2303539 RepID=A0A372DKL9_9GAMM|nr:ATPase, T2SS/T4P/T4SS family [Luteimonas weifangensis]RFP60093.1 type II secretion system protein GspE [Luteimonas weifangensis]
MTDALPPRPGFAFAKRHGATLAGWEEGAARIAHRPGVAPEVFAELRRHCGVPLRLDGRSADAYETLLRELYGDGDDARAIAVDMDAAGLGALSDHLPEPQDLLESEDDAPIIRLLNALFTEAIRQNASDIHIEPFESRLAVRFRVDGVLREVLAPQKAIAPAVVSRVKVMARLDIAEKRLPQDGRISLRVAGRPVDVRVSTIPVGAGGERVVLRLLDKQAGRLDVDALGLPAQLRAQLDGLIHRPHGILLVTGPTGSGKTTTLYAALQRLNDASRNILTVEDPIEYYLDGIGQTQVNPRVDMSFARGLRAILRQDPDVVMIGEIRDLETAQIAIQAALTGHLVLSTLHTNSAVGAVTRLRDMGVEPFLVSAALLGVLSQRLVRTLDPAQSQAYPPTPAECACFGKPWSAELRFRRPLPGAERGAGYRGRTGLYEMLVVDDAFRRGIHEGADEVALTALARQRAPGLVEDGWNKLRAGLTSVEEVLRVTREE